MPGGSGCFIPYCDTGRKGCTEKRTVFSVPRDVELFKKWREVVPKAQRELGPNDKVCHVHFAENDIRKGLRVVVGGKEDIFPMLWRLNPTAVPQFFPSKSLEPNLIPEGYRSKRIRKGPRKPIENLSKMARSSESAENLIENATSIPSNGSDIREDEFSSFNSRIGQEESTAGRTATVPSTDTGSTNISIQNVVKQSTEETTNTTTDVSAGQSSRPSFVDPQQAKLPPSWNWHSIEHPQKRKLCLLPSVSLGEVNVVKAIEITTNNSVVYYVFGKRFDSVDLEYRFQSLSEFEEILNNFDKAKTCKGCTDSTFLNIKFCASGHYHGGVWRSNKCQLLDKSTCYECVKLRNILKPRAKKKNKETNLHSPV